MKLTRLAAAAGISLAVAGAVCLPGCSTVPKMNVSSTIPAAEGTVRYGHTHNGNTTIDLEVKHLANPEKLTPPAHNYVVWMSSNPTATPQNIGAMIVDSDLNGSLKTEVPLHSFMLFVTGEASGQVQVPTGQSLLWTDHNE